MGRGNTLDPTDAIHYHAQLVFPDKCYAIKALSARDRIYDRDWSQVPQHPQRNLI